MNREVGKRSLYQIYRQLWNLLSFRRKRQIIFAFILIISSAVAEMLSILSIYPLLRIITSQKVDNQKNNSILYNAKYVLDFKYLFVNRRNTEKHQIAINQNVDGQTLACTENAFYITMPLWCDTNKHMLDFIYGLADESDNIFQKAILRKRGIGGYKFIKDILGAKEAKAIKKPLMTRQM